MSDTEQRIENLEQRVDELERMLDEIVSDIMPRLEDIDRKTSLQVAVLKQENPEKVSEMEEIQEEIIHD